jgi:hypothetical protein
MAISELNTEDWRTLTEATTATATVRTQTRVELRTKGLSSRALTVQDVRLGSI